MIEQPRGEALPPFLRGFSPDLVVVKDDDHAVVKIRTRESLIGSNEFMELAKAIEAHPEWRLEPTSLGTSRPPSAEVSKDDLKSLLAVGLKASQSGQRAFALVCLVSVLDELVRDLALRHHLTVVERVAPAIVHGGTDAEGSSGKQIFQLIAACHDLHAATRLEVT